MEKSERKDANDAADRVIAAMNKAREVQGIGEVYSSMQLYAQSDEILRKVVADNPSDTEDEWRAELYLALNAAMQGNEGEYRAHAFIARNLKPDESHSRWIKQADEMWKGLVENIARVDELRLQIFARPEAAKVVELLKIHDTKLHMVLDQRVVARWLTEIDDWARDPYVKSGEPQRILAETCGGMKDYLESVRMLERLRKNYPTHEWCRAPENGTRRVDLEVIDCRKRLKRWGLGR